MTIFNADSFVGCVLRAAWVEFDELSLASWAWWVGSGKMSWAWRVGHDELDLTRYTCCMSWVGADELGMMGLRAWWVELDLTRDTCHMSWVGADELGMMGLRAWWVEFDELGLARDTCYMPHVKCYMIHDTWVGSDMLDLASCVCLVCCVWQVGLGKASATWNWVGFDKLCLVSWVWRVELDLASCAWWVGFGELDLTSAGCCMMLVMFHVFWIEQDWKIYDCI